MLVEDPDDLPCVLKDTSTLSGDITFISLSPTVSYAFERSGIPYKSLDQYWKGYQISHQQGLENINKIERISSILDQEFLYLYKNPSLSPVKFSIFHLKILFDTLWTTIWILTEIIRTENPDSIRFFTFRNSRKTIGKYPFSEDESIYSSVLSMAGWKVPITLVKSAVRMKDAKENLMKSKDSINLRSWIKNHSSLYNLGLIGKRVGITAALYSCFLLMTKPFKKPVLLYNNGYNWDDSLMELYRQGIFPVIRLFDDAVLKNNQEYPDYCEEIFRVSRSHPTLNEYNTILGIDVSEFFFLRLSQIIGRAISESVVSYQTASDIIRQNKIQCLILSTRQHAIGHAVVQAAHDAKISVVSWQHGGAGYSDFPLVPYIEFIGSDWHFVFGKKVADNYRKLAESAKIKKIPSFFIAGSSSLDLIPKKTDGLLRRSRKTEIIFVTTAYYKNNLLISYPFDPMGLNEHLWIIQKKVMDLMEKKPEQHFTIKLHPSHTDKEPIVSYIRDHKIDNITVITTEQSIPELMKNAEIVIIDHITTGILQVFTSNIPVIVYTGLYPIDPEAITLLKKRSYTCNTTDEFIDSIDRYLQDKELYDVNVDNENSEFLIAYGTDIHTYNSAHRAAEKLNEIMSN